MGLATFLGNLATQVFSGVTANLATQPSGAAGGAIAVAQQQVQTATARELVQFSGVGGNGMVPIIIQQIQAAGGSASRIAGGRWMATAPNGDVQLFTSEGKPVRPSEILTAGQRLPGGALIVSIRQNGALIGITKRRSRRRFAGEIKRAKDAIKGARQLTELCKPPRKKS